MENKKSAPCGGGWGGCCSLECYDHAEQHNNTKTNQNFNSGREAFYRKMIQHDHHLCNYNIRPAGKSQGGSRCPKKDLTTIGDKTKSLEKETWNLAQSIAALDAFNKPLISRQTELKAALEKGASTVKDRKSISRAGYEAGKMEMTKAIEEQGILWRERSDVEGKIKSNQNTFGEYREALRKSAIREFRSTLPVRGATSTYDGAE